MPAIVNSFMTKYEDLWTNTTTYNNYANITNAQLARNYPIFTKDPGAELPVRRVAMPTAPSAATTRRRRRST